LVGSDGQAGQLPVEPPVLGGGVVGKVAAASNLTALPPIAPESLTIAAGPARLPDSGSLEEKKLAAFVNVKRAAPEMTKTMAATIDDSRFLLILNFSSLDLILIPAYLK
jgi:hypothetical protein